MTPVTPGTSLTRPLAGVRVVALESPVVGVVRPCALQPPEDGLGLGGRELLRLRLRQQMVDTSGRCWDWPGWGCGRTAGRRYTPAAAGSSSPAGRVAAAKPKRWFQAGSSSTNCP